MFMQILNFLMPLQNPHFFQRFLFPACLKLAIFWNNGKNGCYLVAFCSFSLVIVLAEKSAFGGLIKTALLWATVAAFYLSLKRPHKNCTTVGNCCGLLSFTVKTSSQAAGSQA